MWSKYPEIIEELNMVEDFIRKNIQSRNKLLGGITHSLLEAGGKRLRPAFAVLSSKFGNCDREKLVPVAGAIEILHTATLVHDDIVDRAKLRRGKATVADQHGIDMAVYTGDFLFTKAVLLMADNVPADKLEIIAKAVKTICEGEVDQFQDRYNTNISVFSYLKRISRKTAVLFSAACAMGADCAGCPQDIAGKLVKFGFNYGMAFQIRDDLNDLLSDSKAVGKPVENDIAKGIVTLPAIFALNSSMAVRKVLEEVMGKARKLSLNGAAVIADIIKESGGIENSEKVMEKYINRGLKILKGLPDIKYKQAFADLIINLKK